MTWREALSWGKNILEEAEIPDGAWDAECLFFFVTDCNRTELLLNGNQELTHNQEASYRELIEKRKSRVPLQYLTGQQEFMGFPFYVNQDVLIPRQDTECLVEIVLREMENFRGKIRVLDMCTGSGCIGISLAKLAGKRNEADLADEKHIKSDLADEKNVDVLCSDISAKALSVAEINGAKNQAEVSFVESDLFEKITGRFHIIVSNPPYITRAEMKELMPEVRLFEPEGALCGMEDGLHFYREIIRQAPEYLEENGMLFFEIGCSQGEAVRELMVQSGFQNIRIEKDLAGLDRIVYGRI